MTELSVGEVTALDERLDERLDDLDMGTVARRSMGLTVGSIVGSVLSVVTSFVVARWLGPARFGRVQYVLLCYFYAALLRSGAFESGVRRYIRLRAQGREAAARHARDVGTTVDLVLSMLPAAALVVWGLTSRDPLVHRGLVLAPLAVLTTTIGAYLGALRSADGRFDLVAGSGVVRSVAYTLLALGGLAWFGPVALFVAPAIADALAVAVLVGRRPRLGLRWTFDRRAAGSLLRSGVALGVLPVVYWVYRLVGSSSVALGTDAVTFGLFSFAAAPIAVVLRAISTVESVLTPAVWGRLARDEGDRRWVAAADRITISLFVVAGFATNVSQAGFGPLVRRLLPAYTPSVPLFEILAVNILLLSVAVIPSLVLRDEAHGAQNRFLGVWVGALAVNGLANFAVLRAGFGATGVAWDDVGIQAIVLVVLFAMTARRLGVAGWGRRSAAFGVPLAALCGSLAVVLHLADRPAVGLGDAVGTLGGRVVGVTAVWAGVAWSLRRRLTAPVA